MASPLVRGIGARSGDRLQQPPAIAQRHAELFEIALAQFRQDIEVDIVRLERVGILFELVPAQPVAKIAHAMSSHRRAHRRSLA